jgi:hypothetical protein
MAYRMPFNRHPVHQRLGLQDEIKVSVAGFSRKLHPGNPEMRPVLNQKPLKNKLIFTVF